MVNPAPINKNSNKIDHHLKIVDFYIKEGCPSHFMIEPVFGKYNPDLYFQDRSGKDICVEIQLTPISNKKMQEKINQFVKEFNKNHKSNTLVLCSNYSYKKLEIPKNFRVIFQPIPSEIFIKS
jgi:hypothetical protein